MVDRRLALVRPPGGGQTAPLDKASTAHLPEVSLVIVYPLPTYELAGGAGGVDMGVGPSVGLLVGVGDATELLVEVGVAISG